MRILIVEDTEFLASAVAHVLRRHGHHIDVAHDGEAGLRYAKTDVYDVIVLDNMLPKLTGVEVAQALRAVRVTTPVIIISAKSEVPDRIEGLEAGADDYLIKPFKIDELLARITAVARRSQGALENDHIEVGNTRLDKDTFSATTPHGTVTLTAKEFLLLEYLMLHAGKILNKEVLFRRAWGQESFSEENYVEVYLSYLRKKLRSIQATVAIQSTRGLGYALKEVEAPGDDV